jgi:ACS family tartrate transporter-like MFS transporter
MAKLKMLHDVNLTEAAYGFGARLFFVGYFFFEVPSNLILHRIGARLWIARIMITWGIISACMLFTRGRWSFYSLRFLLGVAEAGFFPGIVFYLTHWVPARQRAQILAAFLTSTAVSGIIGNPLAGLFMQLEGTFGLHGWQWLFLIEGIPPVLLGMAMLAISALLPDNPAEAGWLHDRDRQWITDELARDHEHPGVGHLASLRVAFTDRRLWHLSALYFTLIMGLYGFIYWLPTILKSFNAAGISDQRIGLLSAIPYAVGAVTMVLIALLADRIGKRRPVICCCGIIGSIGVAWVAYSHSPYIGMAALCVAAIGIFGTLGPFWTIPTRYLRGTAAAGGIAIVNSTGALAGFVAPYAIGWAKTATGHFTAGLLLVSASLAVGAVLVLCVPTSADGS